MGFMGVKSEKKCCTVVVVISHIQRIGCQPGKSASSDGQSRSWSTENREERKKRKRLVAPPPTLLVRMKQNKKSRDASICLGAT